MGTVNHCYIIEIEAGIPRVLGPYNSSADRRRASVEMIQGGRDVHELDIQAPNATDVSAYAYRVPREGIGNDGHP